MLGGIPSATPVGMGFGTGVGSPMPGVASGASQQNEEEASNKRKKAEEIQLIPEEEFLQKFGTVSVLIHYTRFHFRERLLA
jgi:hypothetical protein